MPDLLRLFAGEVTERECIVGRPRAEDEAAEGPTCGLVDAGGLTFGSRAE